MTEKKQFVATPEAKAQAKQLRLFAMLAWIIAIACEVYAILKLLHNDMLTWLIVAIVVILALSITGSLLWKKSNRLDPASEKDKFRFFVQNQLGAIIAAVAFLPLIILIFTNKELDGKSKGIAGAIGIVALLAAGIVGTDFNPPSIEKYTEQINEQTDSLRTLNDGVDHAYWTPGGEKYHIFKDCQHIKGREIHEGTVQQAWEERKKGDNELCKTCRKRAEKRQEQGGADANAEPAEQAVPQETGAE
ncbi:MAG TPA: hypothetical protein PKD45_12640 [Flavobacteriales bacterium]|nr:hypothetical protein [Flavobacteriales bacterium]